MESKKSGHGGFTLLELLVVVIIIGILATIALPQFTKTISRSREAEAIQILGNILDASWAYRMEKSNVWPATKSELLVDYPASSDNWDYQTSTFTGSGTASTTMQIKATDRRKSDHQGTATIDTTGKKTITFVNP